MKNLNITGCRFGVYNHRFVYDNELLLNRQIIVLRDASGNIKYWTDFHKYAQSIKKGRIRNISSDNGNRCKNIACFLNYVFFDKYKVSKVIDITSEMVKDFFIDYGLCRLPQDDENTHRNKMTVNICVAHIIDFFDLLSRENSKCKMKLDKLYITEKCFSKTKRKYIDKKVPAYEIYYKQKNKVIFRDIPEEAFQIIMNEIINNHKNIIMLAALSAFAGLRPSEACNVRREDSALGPGIRFEKVNGEVTNVYIDLREEKNLRSDLVSVGKIKKERMQMVYPAFLEIFVECYETYMEYIEGMPYEAKYGALTNTSFGKAYTYEAYYKEFKKVVEDCIPKMLGSDNAKTVNYGHMLQENNISPHILRHWFSVKLTLYGEGVPGLMKWRGDKSPESALVYLANKSELEKEFEIVSDEVFNYTMWKAGKMNEKS